mmetsp:Transcript_604/g.2158  ORF Transcript_604/g.2158 Transcript_604/m.2158 type:complete len:278 (+) Transcript_604:272-1105(+)
MKSSSHCCTPFAVMPLPSVSDGSSTFDTCPRSPAMPRAICFFSGGWLRRDPARRPPRGSSRRLPDAPMMEARPSRAVAETLLRVDATKLARWPAPPLLLAPPPAPDAINPRGDALRAVVGDPPSFRSMLRDVRRRGSTMAPMRDVFSFFARFATRREEPGVPCSGSERAHSVTSITSHDSVCRKRLMRVSMSRLSSMLRHEKASLAPPMDSAVESDLCVSSFRTMYSLSCLSRRTASRASRSRCSRTRRWSSASRCSASWLSSACRSSSSDLRPRRI